MADTLLDLIKRLTTSSAESNLRSLTPRLKSLHEFLTTCGEIRIFIRNSQQFGHQSSSVNILRNLIRMGAGGPFTIVLMANDGTDYNDLEFKITVLIPQYKRGESAFQLDGNTITVVRLEEALPKPAALAITGGCDLRDDKLFRAVDQLNVTGYVQLQPYGWTKGQNLFIFYLNEKRVVVDLQESHPALEIVERAFYLPDPVVTTSDLEAIANSDFRVQGEVYKAIEAKVREGAFGLCPIYGISTPDRGEPQTSLLNTLAGIVNQSVTKPTIVLVMARLNDSILKAIGMLGINLAFGDSIGFDASKDFRLWWNNDEDNPRALQLKLVGNGQPSKLKEVNEAINKAGPSDILIVYQPQMPAVLFNHLYSISTFPPVLEGQNTVELMINLGRPYLKITTRDDSRYSYPTLPLHTKIDGLYAQQSQAIVFNGIVMTKPDVWNAQQPTFPPTALPPMYGAYTDAGTELAKYFATLRKFHHDELNDKLLRALDIYVNFYAPSNTELVLAAVGGAEDTPIEKLYAKLKAAIGSDKSLELLSTLSTGLLNEFFSKVVTDSNFKITEAKVSLSPDEKSVTLAGDTTALGTGTASLSFTFTASGEDIASEFKASLKDATLQMRGAQWLAVGNPELSIKLDSSQAISVVATLGVMVRAGFEARMTIQIPTAPDQLLFQAEFIDPKPSMAKIFQMVGGINLEATLPSQLLLGAALELQQIALSYDYKQNVMEYIGVDIGTPAGKTWDLVPAVKVNGLALSALINKPGDLKNRKSTFTIGGDFLIAGTSKATIEARVPQLRVVGGLVEDTDPLSVAAVIEAYLGKSFADALPASVRSTFINKLWFTVDKALGSYSFAIGVNGEWPIEISGKKIFQITQLGLEINATSKDIDPVEETEAPRLAMTNAFTDRALTAGQKTTEITGQFTGSTVILPDTEKIGLDVKASYEGKEKGWTFDGRTTTPIKLGKLLKDQFGFDAGNQAEYNIDSLELTVTTIDNSWVFIGKFSDWRIDFIDLTIKKATVKAGYNGKKSNALAHPAFENSLLPRLAATDDGAGYFADIEVETKWLGMNIDASIQFAQGKKPTWGVTLPDFKLHAEVKQNDEQQWVATLGFTENVTIGSLIETMVSWITGAKFSLEAPWNVLDNISLSGLKLGYNFTTKNVTFTVGIGPIDLGIMRIDAIDVNYESGNADKSKNGLMVTLKGFFPWNVGAEANGDTGSLGPWDASKPGSAPAPPGGGNKYLDLRLLALGQHVTVDGLMEEKTVTGVIEKIKGLKVPTPPEIPIGGPNQPRFAAENSWFVAFDFGILKAEEEKKPEQRLLTNGGNGNHALVRPGAVIAAPPPPPPVYFLSLAIVFNDPFLYGLRIALDGPMAKVFKGLDFQILYQQVSQTVGKYSARLALPDIMRKIQIGVASITLPIFAIEVYTNGDFQVDLGFPWKEDFSLGFSIEIQAGPFPVLGSAGFYFGKLSSATTDKVPKTELGWFNPVIVFGFGAQIGLGKSIEMGILKAGFSVTVFGIIEGVIARWLPYAEPTKEGNKKELQDGYFFSLTGTMGLQGRLYGSINFAIISAELNIAISLYVRITFASFQPIPIMARASVDVSLEVKINLGLFKITIHLGFKAAVEVVFLLDNPMKGPAPWEGGKKLPVTLAASRLSARGLLKQQHEPGLLLALRADAAFNPDWSNLQAGTPLQMKGWVLPVLTVAGDIADKPEKQKVCYVVNFFIETQKPIQESPSDALQAHGAGLGSSAQIVAPRNVAHAALARSRALFAANEANDKFEDLAVRVLQWVIAAGQPAGTKLTPDAVDKLPVSDEFLANTLQYLSDSATPIPAPNVETFLGLQTKFSFTLKQDNTSNGEAMPVVFFPAAPGIELKVPAFAGSETYQYTFGEFNSTSSGYLKSLNDYFNKLKIQVQEEQERQRWFALGAPAEEGPSVASYIFGDYFVMIARLSIQAMRDSLRNFKLVIADQKDKTVQQIVDDINETANPNHITPFDAFTVGELFIANQKHELATDAGTGTGQAGLKISTMTWQSAGGRSFNEIAQLPVFGGGFPSTQLALANTESSTIIAPGIELVGPHNTYTTQSADTLTRIAKELHFPDVPALLAAAQPGILGKAVLLAPQSILNVPDFRHKIAAGDTLQTVGVHYGVDLDALAHSNGDVKNLFSSANDPNLNIPHLVQYQAGKLIDEMKRTLALQHMAAMASRYYLHGLRLPTRFTESKEGLKPKAAGLFVVKKDGAFEYEPGHDNFGLFALTGQAFPLPEIPKPAGGDPIFSFTLTRTDSEKDWLSLGSDGVTLTFTLQDTDDYTRYSSVKTVARKGYLNTQTGGVGPLGVAAVKPARYPLSIEIAWQAAVPIVLPFQRVTPPTPRPRLWSLPVELINLPNSSNVLPTLRFLLARTDEGTGRTVDEPLNNYAFGSLITFTVKKIASTGGSGLTGRTYEIIGAPESDIVLLERLLNQAKDWVASLDQVALFYHPSPTGSDAKGWESDDPSISLMGITQTNLSTDTRPPTLRNLPLLAAAAKEFKNLIGAPEEFLRLLWEASITRQGGFFLIYSTQGADTLKGLPDHTFNDRNEAELAFFALFNKGSDNGRQLANYINAGATNEAFDQNNAALIAEAVQTAVATPRDFKAADTLASYAAFYYNSAGLLAEMNGKRDFRAGVKLTVNGGLYQVSPNNTAPGGNLQAIADYFHTTVAELRAANDHGEPPLPDTLNPYTAIKLPPINITTGSGPNSFEKLSTYYGAPVPQIAAANLDVAGLFPDGPLTVATGPVSLSTVAKQGVAGMVMERPAPVVPDKPFDDAWGEQYLRQNFGLLGYRVADNPQNHYFSTSEWGLPSGPIKPDPADDGDKIQAPRAVSAGDTWDFSFAVPFASLFDGGKKNASPYGGVGGILQFELAWLDIFGNRILSEFDNPTPAAGVPLNKQPQITGYTDRILGIGQWPSIAHAYRVFRDEQANGAALEIQLNFDAGAYHDAGTPAGQLRVKQAIVAYTLILQQLTDPTGVKITLTTSMTPSLRVEIPNTSDSGSLRTWANSVLAYLNALLENPNQNPQPPAEYRFQALLPQQQINTGQIFKLATTVTLSRHRDLVAGELATTAGVADASTQLAPYTGPLSVASQAELPQRNLTQFAQDFTAAFASAGSPNFRIATGSDRNVFNGSGKNPLWVIQLGDPKAAQPISYTITNQKAPTVYAPRPISNTLKSKDKTPIIDYTTGTVIKEDATPEFRSYLSIDLDKWLELTLSWIDELLTPLYVSPAGVLKKKLPGTDALQHVLDAKEALADKLRGMMIPVYADEGDDPLQRKDIQEAFYQSMLGAISQFYAVKAGIQFKADVNASINWQPEYTNVPRVFGEIEMKAVVRSGQESPGDGRNITVSSPKLDLKFATGNTAKPPSPYLSMLVGSTTTDAKLVTLNLKYNGRYIEHEIGTLPGIVGYQPSSWLGFVGIGKTAGDDTPLASDLGQFPVPIVLREFPATPALVNQQSAPKPTSDCYQASSARQLAAGATSALLQPNATCDKPGTDNPIAGATRWNYAFDYSMQVHREQDEIHGVISFNIVDQNRLFADALVKRDFFDNLAEFTQVYPKVRADLNTYLAPIDVNTTDDAVLKNAQAALESAAVMIQWLADSAQTLRSMNADAFFSAAEAVEFTVSEDSVIKDGQDAARMTVKLIKDLPARVGRPLIEFPGMDFTCEPDPGGSGPNKFAFLYKESDGRYVPPSKARDIAARRLVLPDLDILERQDAQTEIYLTRNADIVPNRTIAEPFVYQTPRVSFESPLHPTLVNSDPINLAVIFSNGTPVKRTLECQLSLLYEALFANAGTNSVTLQLTLYYEYALNGAISRVRLPVYLMPQTRVAIREGGEGMPLSDVIALQVNGWQTWSRDNSPDPRDGRLTFELTAMSNLTARPMPVLIMTGLYLPVSDMS